MKIAVLCGGLSMERNVSLLSGERVHNALLDLGYQSYKFDLDGNLVRNLIQWKPDVVYIALHGKNGEDGTVQEMLEMLGYKFTGPSSLSCKLTFDKWIAKKMMIKNGYYTPEFYSFEESLIKELGGSLILEEAAEKLGYPFIIKPSSQGSCFGVRLVHEKTELLRAAVSAFSYDQRIILEKYIHGVEITVPVVGGEILPAVEIKPPRDIFDFSAMYSAGETEYFVPARLEKEVLKRVEDVVSGIVGLFRVEELSRVDIIIEENTGIPYVLEINTSPGMTATSLLPMSAEAKGLTFEKLVEQIVLNALES